MALVVAAAGYEWARLCLLAGARAWIYATLVALALIGALAAGEAVQRAIWMLGAVFWIVLVPVWRISHVGDHTAADAHDPSRQRHG